MMYQAQKNLEEALAKINPDVAEEVARAIVDYVQAVRDKRGMYDPEY